MSNTPMDAERPLFRDVEQKSASSDWGIRIGIAVFFLIFGAEKFSSDPHSSWVGLFREIGLGAWFQYFTGLVEIAGAVLVLIPPTATAGLLLLACTMAGGAFIHLVVLHHGAVAIFPAAIGAFLLAWTVMRR